MRHTSLRAEHGFTLMETLIGIAITLLVIGVVADFEIQTIRSKIAYNDAFAKYGEAGIAVDWLTKDLRRASAAPQYTDCGSTIAFAVYNPDRTTSQVLYQLNSSNQLTRTVDGNPAKVLANNVSTMSFCSDSPAVIHVKMQVVLSGGGNYEFDSHVAVRSLVKPST